MNAEQKYLFDLQGYIALKGVVPAEVVKACNEVLDRYEGLDEEDYPPPLCLGQERTKENLYISNILEGDETFRALIDVPEVIDVIAEVKLRVDAEQEAGAEPEPVSEPAPEPASEAESE